MPESLLDKTLKLLRNDPRNLSQIATISGLGYFWLRQVKNGTIKTPASARSNAFTPLFPSHESQLAEHTGGATRS